MSNTNPPAKAPARKRDPHTLEVKQEKAGQSREQMLAQIAYDPAVRSLSGAKGFIKGSMGEQALTESLDALMAQVIEVRSGNLQSAERTLVAQANTLDAIFNELARRAAMNMGEYINAAERYLRLALKAQSQCRATLETLATIKNPPVIYAKQANIANGPQQVNNGTLPAPAHGENVIEPNKLLEQQHGQRLDNGTAGKTIGTDPAMATVGQIDRPEIRSRKS